jgi:hypothetical protein
MARKKTWREAPAPVGRDFTAEELIRIRELVQGIPTAADGHPSWQTVELERIHQAAGSRRGFKMWELGGPVHDPARAFEEELEHGLPVHSDFLSGNRQTMR